MSRITLRALLPADVSTLTQLFLETVHAANAAEYTPAHLDAWAPAPPDAAAWTASFRGRHALVAVADGCITGFADMTPDGYLDRLYVSPRHQRQGVATALCNALESLCTAPVLTTHASLTARDFFLRRGYVLQRMQQVERRGMLLTNCVMQKTRT